MATLIKQDGRYYLQFFDGNRSPVRKKVPLKTTRKGPALVKQRELEDAFTERRFDPWLDDPFGYYLPVVEAVSVAHARDWFIEEKRKDGRTENTIRTYEEITGLLLQRCGESTRLEAVKPDLLRAFVRDPSVSPATRYKRFGHVRTFFRWCKRKGLTSVNPLEELSPPPKPSKLPKSITEPELKSLCEALREDYETKRERETIREGELIWRIPLFWFAYYTGMRASELARLKWEHVDRVNGLIYIYQQKNGKEQTIPLNRKARGVLESVSHGCERGYVFHPPNAESRTRKARYFRERASRAFRDARKMAGLSPGLSFHSLRHGFCTRLAEAGKPLYVIKEAARHADVSTSLIYVHMANEHLKAELDDVFG